MCPDMKEGQESIYYACGDNLARIETMPQIELLKDKGLEVLYLTDVWTICVKNNFQL